jgi:ribosomal protein S18 acetylase RimI-like enzyme
MVIRPAHPDDVPALARFAERSFREAFAADSSPADMNTYCAQAFSVATQAAVLQDPAIDTLVSVDEGGAIVAYAQLRPGKPDGDVLPHPRARDLLSGGHDVSHVTHVELWRFYVAPAHHGRGLAQALMAAVLSAARARGARTLWLGVWDRNPKAQAFYRKIGFVDVGSHQFVLGSDVQTDRLMALSLQRVQAFPARSF